jgi:hypothetical protein
MLANALWIADFLRKAEILAPKLPRGEQFQIGGEKGCGRFTGRRCDSVGTDEELEVSSGPPIKDLSEAFAQPEPAQHQGSITIFVTFSFLSRQILYMSGACSSLIRCEIM